MLEGIGLTKSFGSQKIVDNVSLALNPGEISVIIGPSGSGKTTLLKVLALVEQPDSGKIIVDDEQFNFPPVVASQPPWPKITVVFQQLFLWPHLTLLQNIQLPLSLRQKAYNGKDRRVAAGNLDPGFSDQDEQRRLGDLIELFEMQSFVHRYPNEASLGQRQRAALARAVILQPKYLLLDEITSSLDVEQISIILSYLRKLSKKGIGIVIVTHLLNFARDAADKIIFIDGGQIIESGGREVLDAPKQERVKKFLSVIESAS